MAKANFRNMGSLLSRGSSNHSSPPLLREYIAKEGVLRKTKNMKKRYFVLWKEINKDNPAKLEYYESQKKFESGSPARREYLLKDFYISRKVDPKCQYCFALFNKDCIPLMAESKSEMLDWLKALKQLKNMSSDTNGSAEYKHVWRVEVQNRGVGSTNKLFGTQLVILTNGSLSLVRCESPRHKIDIVLNTIRRCGHTDQFFFIEIGSRSKIGSGILWMKTEDPLIAENMKSVIHEAMNTCGRHDMSDDRVDPMLPPMPRFRVSSLTDSSDKDGFLSEPQKRSRTMSETGIHTRPYGIGGFPRTNLESVCSNSGEMSDCGDPNYLLPVTRTESSYVEMDGNHHSESFNLDHNELSPEQQLLLNKEVSSPRPIQQPDSAYLDMTGHAFQSPSTPISSSIPIPISGARDSSYAEMSPKSQSSTSTSRTTSSDQLHEGGSASTVGSGSNPAEEVLDRPIRTSSVGSKAEQPFRKSRNETTGIKEPGRARAFTIGSHPHYNVARAQTLTVGGVKSPPRSCDPFPSIHEVSSQNKCKSCSTSHLLSSPVSHSWSGTSGAYFRNHMHTKEDNRMMLDYSKSGSIGEDNDPRGLGGHLGIHRVRSNSKSSGSSNQRSSDWTGSYSESMDAPSRKKSDDYFEIGFNNSPRNSSHMENNTGYLFMTGSKLVPPSNVPERKSSSHGSYLDLSAPSETSVTSDGYIDMSQGSKSVTIGTSEPEERRGFRLHSPMSLDLSSPHGDFMTIDAFSEDKSGSRKKSSRKSNKRSFKEGAKSRKSDPGSFLSWSQEDNSDSSSKSKGALSTITSLITRKSQTAKSPASPQQSLLPRGSLGNTSPFASLTRSKNKENKDAVVSESPDKTSSTKNGATSPRIPGEIQTIVSKPSDESKSVGLSITPEEPLKSLDVKRPVPDHSASPVHVATSEVFSGPDQRNYVNMSINSQSSQLQDRTSSNVPPTTSVPVSLPSGDENYMLMDGSQSRKSIDQTPQVLSSSSHVTLDRARSLSGPGAPNAAGKVKSAEKKLSEDGRTLSACSSPVSNSPPLSPNLGSVSSMSSLSEGGLSSASSTSTVINVGLTRSVQAVPQPNAAIRTSKDTTAPNVTPEPTTTEDAQAAPEANTNLNYVSLDLRESADNRTSSRGRSDTTSQPDESSYASIDFVRSEGLRNTTLGRDSNRQ